jgi:hypothetical protein
MEGKKKNWILPLMRKNELLFIWEAIKCEIPERHLAIRILQNPD